METSFIKQARKTGRESFVVNGNAVGVSMADYWAWACSDVINNTERGKLAEFIVASALGVVDGVRSTWEKYDLLFMGRGVEVKSAAYVQAWHQAKPSPIVFSIRPTRGWDAATGQYDAEQKRQADIYVFCLLAHTDHATLNPLDLGQWEFYIVPTAWLNKRLSSQKSVSLPFLRQNNITPTTYTEICSRVEDIFRQL